MIVLHPGRGWTDQIPCAYATFCLRIIAEDPQPINLA